jgi:hypothetical protein
MQIQAAGEGLDGSTATCLTSSKGGAVVFTVRDGYKPGYQPFAKAERLDFWIKSNTKSSDVYASSTPKGLPPPLKVFLMSVSSRVWRLACYPALCVWRLGLAACLTD